MDTNDDKRYADGLVSIVPRVRKIEDLLSDQLASRWKFSGVAPRSLPPQGGKKKSNQLSSAEIEKIIDCFKENPINQQRERVRHRPGWLARHLVGDRLEPPDALALLLLLALVELLQPRARDLCVAVKGWRWRW